MPESVLTAVISLLGALIVAWLTNRVLMKRAGPQNDLDNANAIEQLQEALERQIAAREKDRKANDDRIIELTKRYTERDTQLQAQIRELQLAIGGPFQITTVTTIITHPKLEVLESRSTVSIAPGSGTSSIIPPTGSE